MNDISIMILKKIRELFGKEPKIYRENVKNGFNEFSFYIPALHVKSKTEIGDKLNLTYSCQVIFLPRENHINDDIQQVEDKLLTGFLNLENNDVFNREFVISDNALVFTFDLIGFYVPQTSGSKIEKIDVKGK